MSNSSETHTALTFNLLDVEENIRLATAKAGAESLRLQESAQAKAREILAAALAEKAAIHQKAREEGHKQGYEEGLKQGRVKGEESEKASARDLLKPQVEALQKVLAELPRFISEARQRLVDESERDLVGLALEAASIAVAHEVKDPGPTVRAELVSLAGLLATRRNLVVETNPEHVASLESLVPGLAAQIQGLGEIRLRGVVGLPPCSVRVVSDAGDASMSPESALVRLRAEWGL
ncbi:MAG: hypothetical protein AB7F75_05995 [Planctomycetota bacterium]